MLLPLWAPLASLSVGLYLPTCLPHIFQVFSLAVGPFMRTHVYGSTNVYVSHSKGIWDLVNVYVRFVTLNQKRRYRWLCGLFAQRYIRNHER